MFRGARRNSTAAPPSTGCWTARPRFAWRPPAASPAACAATPWSPPCRRSCRSSGTGCRRIPRVPCWIPCRRSPDRPMSRPAPLPAAPDRPAGHRPPPRRAPRRACAGHPRRRPTATTGRCFARPASPASPRTAPTGGPPPRPPHGPPPCARSATATSSATGPSSRSCPSPSRRRSARQRRS